MDLALPASEEALDELLSRPTPAVVEALSAVTGDIVILGGGGKVGPTLARMAKRALDEAGSTAQVHSVSRWSDPHAVEMVRAHGVNTISADLADPDAWASLPDAGAVLYLLGHKFGTASDPSRTWWMNAVAPGFAAARYRGVPTVVYSSGNVYPLTPVSDGGCTEDHELGPVGTYAQSCVAREQAFVHAAHTWGTPVTLYRLNYAVELRYGVLCDIASQLRSGQPVDVTMSAVNIVWQGDSNAWSLASLAEASPEVAVLNGTGPEMLSTTWLAEQLGALGGWEVQLTGVPAETALLSNATRCHARYGYPTVSPHTAMRWVVEWMQRDGRLLGRPTKFQTRDGGF